MFFGALVIFSALQDALNQIWGVQKAPSAGILYSVKRRLLAFVMVLLVGILLLGSLLISAAFALVQAYWERWLDFDPTFGLWSYTDALVSLVFFTGVFGVVYKLLPDVQMAWRDVWLGAFMTSLMFLFGEFLINLYLTYTSVGSVFGAAGTLAVVLTWVYYSWMTILMGAEMTQVWARKHGQGIRPGKNAVLLVDVTKKVWANGDVEDPDVRTIVEETQKDDPELA
jgi:membrane protein